MCNRSKATNILDTISRLEQWVRDQNISPDLTTSFIDMMQPIVQAARLLKAKKSKDEVGNLCNMCSHLTTAQIIQLLILFTPSKNLEDTMAITFIAEAQEELQKRADSKSSGKILMDIKFPFSAFVPFNPSSIKLEDIEIPAIMDLPMLKKI